MSTSAKLTSLRKIRDTVSVKGIRNGLLFTIADDAAISDVLTELAAKLQGSHQQAESGSNVTAYLDIGDRELSFEEGTAIRQLFVEQGHMTLGGFSGQPAVGEWQQKDPYVFKGTVRSGKIIEHDGDVVIIGDVNPGAQIIASGDVFVMGVLRGSAYAGASGNLRAVVAATYFDPIQVRIGGVIRRSPERHGSPAEMEFAFLEGDQMAIEKMSALPQHRANKATRAK